MRGGARGDPWRSSSQHDLYEQDSSLQVPEKWNYKSYEEKDKHVLRQRGISSWRAADGRSPLDDASVGEQEDARARLAGGACPVCVESGVSSATGEDNGVVLPCGHVYHQFCARKACVIGMHLNAPDTDSVTASGSNDSSKSEQDHQVEEAVSLNLPDSYGTQRDGRDTDSLEDKEDRGKTPEHRHDVQPGICAVCQSRFVAPRHPAPMPERVRMTITKQWSQQWDNDRLERDYRQSDASSASVLGNDSKIAAGRHSLWALSGISDDAWSRGQDEDASSQQALQPWYMLPGNSGSDLIGEGWGEGQPDHDRGLAGHEGQPDHDRGHAGHRDASTDLDSDASRMAAIVPGLYDMKWLEVAASSALKSRLEKRYSNIDFDESGKVWVREAMKPGPDRRSLQDSWLDMRWALIGKYRQSWYKQTRRERQKGYTIKRDLHEDKGQRVDSNSSARR